MDEEQAPPPLQQLPAAAAQFTTSTAATEPPQPQPPCDQRRTRKRKQPAQLKGFKTQAAADDDVSSLKSGDSRHWSEAEDDEQLAEEAPDPLPPKAPASAYNYDTIKVGADGVSKWVVVPINREREKKKNCKLKGDTFDHGGHAWDFHSGPKEPPKALMAAPKPAEAGPSKVKQQAESLMLMEAQLKDSEETVARLEKEVMTRREQSKRNLDKMFAMQKERDAALEKVADLESLLPPKLREEWERIQAVKARGS